MDSLQSFSTISLIEVWQQLRVECFYVFQLMRPITVGRTQSTGELRKIRSEMDSNPWCPTLVIECVDDYAVQILKRNLCIQFLSILGYPQYTVAFVLVCKGSVATFRQHRSVLFRFRWVCLIPSFLVVLLAFYISIALGWPWEVCLLIGSLPPVSSLHRVLQTADAVESSQRTL